MTLELRTTFLYFSFSLVLGLDLCHPPLGKAEESHWLAGVARADITPQEPIWMAGYGSRDKPSEGVLMPLSAKALALESRGGSGLLITADLIGYRRPVADLLYRQIMSRTGLARAQILLNPSHTHSGPVLGLTGATGYGLEGERERRVNDYTVSLADKFADLAAEALADLRPATLSYGVGVADFVMNRREFTDRGVRLGVNPSGYADRSVPVLAVRSGQLLRAVVFGCACHNTTLGGDNYQICGDYAGFAQEYLEQEQSGLQAMFMIGCGGDANPYPRGTIEQAQAHGAALGQEVKRVCSSTLLPVSGPLRAILEEASLPLATPVREQLESLAKGPSYVADNAKQLLAALEGGETLPTTYAAPISVWQFGNDLTLVALSGEVVAGYVPLIQRAIGPRKLWIAGYTNDCFGYLPTARVLDEGGYETRGLIFSRGFFTPASEDALVAKVRSLAIAVGRSPEQP